MSRRPRPAIALLPLLSFGLFSIGCDETPAAPPPPRVDRALECVPEGEADPEAGTDMDGGVGLRCPAGQNCISGRCYAACTDDTECGPRETCSNGVCVAQVGPIPDSGPGGMDSGPGMPCDGVMCTDPEVCHPLSGQCGECSEDTVMAPDGAPGACSGLRPICDIANGRCVEFAPAQCAPCNVNAECDPGDGSFTGECVARDILGWREQVCLRTCDATTPCPPGLDCVDGRCEPFAGAPCTTWRRAIDRAMCLSDADCNIANSAGASVFFVDTCEGEMAAMPPDGGMGEAGVPDAGPSTPGTCVQPCGSDVECFDMAGGEMCLDTGGGLTFCIVP